MYSLSVAPLTNYHWSNFKQHTFITSQSLWSGVWARPQGMLCSGSHKPAIKASVRLCSNLELRSSTKLTWLCRIQCLRL